MFELRQLRTFHAVATAKSVTRAATTLAYAQSSVTAQIQALEQDLGVPLFDRVGRRVELTQVGQTMMDYAERILALTEEARATIASDQEPSGSLVISAPESLLTYRLPKVICKFQERYPRVEIELTVNESCVTTAGQLSVNSSTDIAFVLDQRSVRTQLVIASLSVEKILVVASAGHRIAGAKRFHASQLQDEQMLLTERGGYRLLFEQAVAAAGARLTKILELPSIEAIKQCAMAGMGLAVLPGITVAREVAQGQLVSLPWPPEPITVHVQMIRHADKWQSPAVSAFWKLAERELMRGRRKHIPRTETAAHVR